VNDVPQHPGPEQRLPGDGSTPKWQRLHRELLRRIGNGEFEDGFPGEFELSESYALSRHTVREALRRLREEGVLESSRGRVTRVRSRTFEQPLGSLYSLFREVESRGHVQRSTVLDVGMRQDAAVAAVLGRPAEAELFYLERLRLVDGEPLAHDKVWLVAEVGRPLLGADFSHVALYEEMTRLSGVRPNGGQERITAMLPGTAQRELLGIGPRVACFEIERLGQVRDQPPVECRISVVRGDRYSLLTSWTPSGFRMGAEGH